MSRIEKQDKLSSYDDAKIAQRGKNSKCRHTKQTDSINDRIKRSEDWKIFTSVN